MTNLLANFSMFDNGATALPDSRWAHAGLSDPIELPILDINDVRRFIGELIAKGDFGKVYNVVGTFPKRVYKVISADEFISGNEIRIAEIAGKIGVAPPFRRAFLTYWSTKPVVFIEMDDGGKSLEQIYEELNMVGFSEVKPDDEAPSIPTGSASAAPYFFSSEPYDGEEMTGIYIPEIQPDPPAQEKIIESVYKKPETFYFELFSQIKLLAENFISYTDTHLGNILLNKKSKRGLQLIDFGRAMFHPTVEEAITASLLSRYNQEHLSKFKSLEKLSKLSQSLINFLEHHTIPQDQDREAV